MAPRLCHGVARRSLVLAALACSAKARPDGDPNSKVGVAWGDDAVKAARSPQTVMRLHMMPDKGLKGMGAVCLDGTDAGFYFAPASSPSDNKSWQIYFQGGGWCYDEQDCLHRSNTPLGSSAHWAQTVALQGIMSDDCSVNPDFCNFNRVHLVYCDGFSFAGDRTEPLQVQGAGGQRKPIYFRGKRILDAVLETLMGMGLREAERVLLTGCSAGGLATFLHADYVHSVLQGAGVPLKVYKAAPISGFFLEHSSVEGAPVYVDEMKSAFQLANATGGLNERCVASFKQEDRWRCSFAAHAYEHTGVPIFPLNSELDSWQTMCIFASRLPPGFPNQVGAGNGWCNAVPGWYGCISNPEKCNASQVASLNHYMKDFERDMLTAGTSWRKVGNGAFIHSCHTHCEAQENGAWTTFAVGGRTMQQAFSSWWKSTAAPAAEHSRTDCAYHPEAPHHCNPTCGGRVDLAPQFII